MTKNLPRTIPVKPNNPITRRPVLNSFQTLATAPNRIPTVKLPPASRPNLPAADSSSKRNLEKSKPLDRQGRRKHIEPPRPRARAQRVPCRGSFLRKHRNGITLKHGNFGKYQTDCSTAVGDPGFTGDRARNAGRFTGRRAPFERSSSSGGQL